MSTATEKSITAEEFFDWVQLPANRGRRFELIQGEVIETPPPGKYHGFVCGNIGGILGNYAIQHARGYVCTNDAGVIVGRNPDSVRGPDVTFYDDEETAETMEPVLVDGNEFIGGGDELPEFRCCVSEFFSTPAKSK